MIVACVDVGSTFTKAAAVHVPTGELLGTAAHRTTSDTDVLAGLDAAVAGTGCRPDEVLACSSAGGGLRLAVIGYEQLVTAQAGYRAGLSAGAKVVQVAAGKLDAAELAGLRTARPDVVLLAGGADGGDAEVITHNAVRLADLARQARWRVPVVLAGNADCRGPLAALLTAAGVPVTAVGNVLPSIGVLDPEPARRAIREVFLRHVIGGKKLSRGTRFASLVRSATPDAVLTGVQTLAGQDGDLLVVDVGGATTDVYSVLTALEDGVPGRDVVGWQPAARTVEGDLGMRWSASTVVAAAEQEKLLTSGDARGLRGEVDGIVAQLPASEHDTLLARLALTLAVRRHARSGRDLRAVQMVVGSGGALRHAPAGAAELVLRDMLQDYPGGWALPDDPRITVDTDCVLAAAGLLAADHAGAAGALLARLTEHGGGLLTAGQRTS